MDIIVLKLGGSIITDKHRQEPALNKGNILRISKEISTVLKSTTHCSLIIVNGAGSFGHPLASKAGIADGLTADNRLAIAQCQAQVNELNSLICKELLAAGVAAYPFQASSSSVSSGKRLEGMSSSLIELMLGKGMVPVLFGTPCYDKKTGFCVLSGDQIISYLTFKLPVSAVIFATDVDGIFDKNPSVYPDAKLLSSLNALQLKAAVMAGSSSAVDVTGGMGGKVGEILAMRPGVCCQIVNGNRAGTIERALQGDKTVGTFIAL